MRDHDWSPTGLGAPEQWPQALKTSLRLLLNSGHPMYVWWGQDLLCFYNDAYRQSIGPERHPGSLGQPARQVWDEIWPIIGPQIDQVMSGGGATWQENALVPITRNGRREDVYWTYSYSPIDDESADGGIGGVLVVCAETTAQVLAAKQAMEDRKGFAELFEQAPTFMAMLRGPEHRFERVNPGYLRLIAHRQVLGLSVAEALPDAARQGFVDLLDQVYRTGEPYVATRTLYQMQAELNGPIVERYVDFVYQPIKDELGQVSGILVEGADVTDAHVAEQGRRASEEQFGALAQAIPNQAWAAPPNGQLDWFNYRVYEYSGAQPGELDGDGWAGMVHPDDVASAGARWAAALASGERYETEFRLRRADGEYRWHLARAVAIKADDGAVTRWIGTNTDIDDQKRASALLEEQVQARTRELMETEAALRQSQKMEAVGQLTGGIAHDFNNLLMGVTGSLEMMQIRMAQGRLNGIERYVDAAQGAARRAASLTQRLLAFSRRQTLDPKPTDVNALVGGMLDLIRRTIGPSIELEVIEQAGLWSALVDPSQLENALLNLCINARDSMPDGGRLIIETANRNLTSAEAAEQDLPPGPYLTLCVTDTGAGMSADVIAHVFEPFFTTKPLGEGTGLGLSMIYGFVRQSGGQVHIRSEVGRGTTMALHFPRNLTNDDQIPAADTAGLADQPQTSGAGKVVLVVDDEPSIRMLIGEVLDDAGYLTLEAADGPSGLRMLQSRDRIDLLITDVGLPGGVNGRQIADAARVSRPDLKVLFITGYAESAALGGAAMEAGMQVLTKPFAMEALARRIRDLIAD